MLRSPCCSLLSGADLDQSANAARRVPEDTWSWASRSALHLSDMATTSTEVRQVELAQPRGIGEYVDFDNLVTPDRKAHNRKRPSFWKPHNDSRGPVHQRRLRELGKLRE